MNIFSLFAAFAGLVKYHIRIKTNLTLAATRNGFFIFCISKQAQGEVQCSVSLSELIKIAQKCLIGSHDKRLKTI